MLFTTSTEDGRSSDYGCSNLTEWESEAHRGSVTCWRSVNESAASILHVFLHCGNTGPVSKQYEGQKS